MDNSFLPQDNIVGKVKDKTVFESLDWQSAKTACDSAAAERVVEKLWKPGKTEALQAKLSNRSRGLAVISQPSTTGLNVLAYELAKKLANELHADCYLGDDFYNALHSTQSKHIARLQRPFNPREYVAVDPDRIYQTLAGKTIIVAEDVLTTGSSVKHFLKALQRDGIRVSAVAALLGDRRLAVDDKTREALIEAFRENGIDLPPEKTEALADSLTRTEARGIALLANNVRSENGREELTRKLQRILDQGIAPGLERTADRRRDESAQGKDPGYEGAPQGIQAWHIQDSTLVPGSPLESTPPSIQEPQSPIQSSSPNVPVLNREFFSDRRLPVHKTDIRLEGRVSGRLVGTGLHEQNGTPYILIESPDGIVHFIHQSCDAMKSRAAGLRVGNFLELTSTPFVADDGIERVQVKFRSLGSAQALLTDKTFLTKEVQRFVELNGTLPEERSFCGWLRDYQRTLRSTAQDLVHQGVIRPGDDGRYHFDQPMLMERSHSVLRRAGEGRHLSR